jgi:predicted metal-binding protein
LLLLLLENNSILYGRSYLNLSRLHVLRILDWNGVSRLKSYMRTSYMKDNLNRLIEKAKELGATRAAILNTSDIRFSEEFRRACERNACGKYGTNWMCPPAVGPFEDLKAKALGFSRGLVFQTVHQLQDSFDYDGMIQAAKKHEEVFRSIQAFVQTDGGFEKILGLNAGECKVCDKCNYPDGRQCRFPDKAVASVESYGIDVNALVTCCGIPYNNGPNTVSYVGLFLF